MSVSLILVPVAMAAVAAVSAARAGGAQAGTVCAVHTRMRDADLLAAALRDSSATVDTHGDDLLAAWTGVRARFTRGPDGVWSAHFTGEVDEARAVAIVRAVDAAYGRQVQRAVLDRLRERAPLAGLRVESESVGADESVRLVFTVEEGGAA